MLDSRDLIAELEELEEQDEDGNPLDADQIERRDAIRELAEAGIEDWYHGATLIPEDEFEDYARQYAEDIGETGMEDRWPYMYVDWEAAANALQQDYTVVEFEGVTYYVR